MFGLGPFGVNPYGVAYSFDTTSSAALAVGIGLTSGDGFGFTFGQFSAPVASLSMGDGFDRPAFVISSSGRQQSLGDSFVLPRIAASTAAYPAATSGAGVVWTLASGGALARNESDGAGFGLSWSRSGSASVGLSSGAGAGSSRSSAAQSGSLLCAGDGFGLARSSVGFAAYPVATTGDGYGWGVAAYGATVFVGEFLGITFGDGFGRSLSSIGTARSVSATTADAQTSLAVVSRLSARPIPTYAGSSTSAVAVLSISWTAASEASGFGSGVARIGQAELHLGVFLEPSCSSAYAVAHDSYVMSFASVYSSANIRGKQTPVPTEYRRATFEIKPKSFEAINLWTNRQFITSGSTNTRTLHLTL